MDFFFKLTHFYFLSLHFLTFQNWLHKSRLLSSLTKEIPSVCIDLSMKSWLLGPQGPMSVAAEYMWQTICLQQGDQGVRAWVSAHHTARPVCLLSGDEKPAQTRPAVPRWALSYTHYYLPEECHPSQVEKLQFGEECRKNPTKTSASFPQENKVFLIDKALPKHRDKWMRCRLRRDLLICSLRWDGRIGEERRTVRQSVKVNKKSKRDQCNLNVIYF